MIDIKLLARVEELNRLRKVQGLPDRAKRNIEEQSQGSSVQTGEGKTKF